MDRNEILKEKTFETAVTEHLLSHGWHAGDKAAFTADVALDKRAVLEFVQTSQPKQWAKLAEFYRTDAEEKFISRLFRELDLRGMLDVLRHGITDSGVKFKLAYFKPDSNLNPETIEQYSQNKLYVTRQVYFSTKNKKSIDLLLALNGLPVATI